MLTKRFKLRVTPSSDETYRPSPSPLSGRLVIAQQFTAGNPNGNSKIVREADG